MSAAEIADYVSFRRAQRNLYGIVNKTFFIDVDSNISYFNTVKRNIEGLRVYTEIADMNETGAVLDAASRGKSSTGLLGGDRKRFTAEIHDNLPPVLRMSDLLAVTRIPPRNPAMKGRIVDMIRKLDRIKENMPEIPAGKRMYSDSNEIFIGGHGVVYSSLVGLAGELLIADPLVESEQYYADAKAYLYPKDDSENRKKLENLMPALASFDALFGLIKPYHGITDADLGPTKEFLQMREQLGSAYARIRQLGEQLEERQDIKILPKNKEAFEALLDLQKKLMASIGANEQNVYVKIPLEESVMILENIIISGLGDKLKEKDENLLTLAWGATRTLNDLDKTALLDQTHKKLVQDYSFGLLEFLASKGYTQTSLH